MTMLTWRKASGCHHNGTCLEVAETWRTSSHTTGGNCVAVAPLGGIAVRDSKNPDDPHLHFGRNTFAAFLHGLAAA